MALCSQCIFALGPDLDIAEVEAVGADVEGLVEAAGATAQRVGQVAADQLRPRVLREGAVPRSRVAVAAPRVLQPLVVLQSLRAGA